jgi:hypothetical protein
MAARCPWHLFQVVLTRRPSFLGPATVPAVSPRVPPSVLPVSLRHFKSPSFSCVCVGGGAVELQEGDLFVGPKL